MGKKFCYLQTKVFLSIDQKYYSEKNNLIQLDKTMMDEQNSPSKYLTQLERTIIFIMILSDSNMIVFMKNTYDLVYWNMYFTCFIIHVYSIINPYIYMTYFQWFPIEVFKSNLIYITVFYLARTEQNFDP